MGEALERLDDEIARFVREQLEREGPVTGWVLCTTHLRYDDDGDTQFGWDYTCGPQTDLVRAVGLLEVVRTDVKGTLTRAAAPDPDDDRDD